MSVLRYNGSGIKLLSKEIDGMIKQLRAMVDLQLRCAETAQEACLQITKAAAENPDAKIDVSSFWAEACQSYQNTLAIKEDIVLLIHYHDFLEHYYEIVRNNCDTYALMSNEDEFFSELTAETKEKVCKAIKRNSYKKTYKLIQLLHMCGEELE